MALSSAIFAARRASTPAILLRTSVVPRCGGQTVKRGIVDLAANQGGGGLGHEQRALGNRAQGHACLRADTFVVQRDVDANTHHRNVHLGARGEAQIGIARRARAGGKLARLAQFALLQRIPAGADRNVFHRDLALALG